jgi:hypothetical protein
MTRLDQLALEIAAGVVEGPAMADVVMEERECAGDVSAEAWRDYQRMKVVCTATGIEAALRVLAAGGPGPPSLGEIDRLTHRLAVGWEKMERHRSAEFDDALRDVAAGGDR